MNGGATDKPNPCAGIKRNKEDGRDIYITDEELSAILKHADPVLQDAVELAYLTGQRPADVLRLRETDIREGCLEFRQGKTNTPLRISINATLLAVLERCKTRKRGTIYSTAIITGTHGKPISVPMVEHPMEQGKRCGWHCARYPIPRPASKGGFGQRGFNGY